MDFSSKDEIKNAGFRGFRTVQELWNDTSSIPANKGVYMVLVCGDGKLEFVNPGTGGFFKDKDPNVSLNVLRQNYDPDTIVLYIGKAGAQGGKATLRSRLNQYLRFGQGKKVGHWGGRLIWQIESHADLVICWKPTPEDDPRQVERGLIKDYENQFGRLPFANLSR